MRFLYNTINAHTNRGDSKIAALEAQGKLTRRSCFQKWKLLTLEELNGFLAIIINMGVIKVPKSEDYWKSTWESQIPFFTRVMPRDRFELIIFCILHISHAEGSIEKRIDKVRILLERLLEQFRKCYYPTRELAVDETETMVGFGGDIVSGTSSALL